VRGLGFFWRYDRIYRMETYNRELLRAILQYPNGHRFYANDILLHGKTVGFYHEDFKQLHKAGIVLSECSKADAEDLYLDVEVNWEHPAIRRLQTPYP